ncbi:MAG: hypothetical protein H6713_21140 [Myxococcales bacterium]|nr:hypothetical protein [Myxococcales bacterium]MCB9752468.1 hypothetical protein [Myxococcales bacterium]
MVLLLETLALDPAIKSLCREVLATSADYREAAARLDITRAALGRYLEKYGLSWRPERPDARDSEPDPGDDALVLEVQSLAELERTLCIRALARAGEIPGAAALLGLSEHALRRRIIVHRINPEMLPDR